MSITDFIAALALAISGASFGIQFAQWFRSGARIKLSLMADATTYPATDKRPKLALTAINRGDGPTMITHMIAFSYTSRWHRLVRSRRPKTSGIVNAPNIPSELKPGDFWIGIGLYDNAMNKQRADGNLYVGVICSHTDRYFLVRVPPKSADPLPTGTKK